MSSKKNPEKISVVDVIRLARLSAEKENVASLEKDFQNILHYVEQLQDVDVEGIEPLAHVHESYNVFREDKADNLLTTEEALLNAPDRSGNFIKVPLVIEDSE